MKRSQDQFLEQPMRSWLVRKTCPSSDSARPVLLAFNTTSNDHSKSLVCSLPLPLPLSPQFVCPLCGPLPGMFEFLLIIKLGEVRGPKTSRCAGSGSKVEKPMGFWHFGSSSAQIRVRPSVPPGFLGFRNVLKLPKPAQTCSKGPTSPI